MINNYSIINIYEKPKNSSKLSSQMIYGEKFNIIYKKKNWLKIKTKYDNYIGYIKKRKFLENFSPTLKVSSLKSKIFFKKKNKFKQSKKYLYFGSRIEVKSENKIFIEFKKNQWIKKRDLKLINSIEKNYIKIFKLFVNCPYLWGGKTANGIDCSSLIQIYFYYNGLYFPRDTKDQIKFCKKKIKKKFLRGNIIFWKGHVGICIDKFKFIHAYGPKKKVLIMPTNYTINLIKRTANLTVKKISSINNFNPFQN